jgi:hypothetical protein
VVLRLLHGSESLEGLVKPRCWVLFQDADSVDLD